MLFTIENIKIFCNKYPDNEISKEWIKLIADGVTTLDEYEDIADELFVICDISPKDAFQASDYFPNTFYWER